MDVFHYHLVTNKARQVEARYLAKLGFDLVARYGRIGEDIVSFEQGTSWDDLDRVGFKLRLSELQLGAVNVVVQPGQWDVPRVDHIGLALDEDEFVETLERAQQRDLRSRSTAAGGRSSPPVPATGSSCTRRATGSRICSAPATGCGSPRSSSARTTRV